MDVMSSRPVFFGSGLGLSLCDNTYYIILSTAGEANWASQPASRFLGGRATPGSLFVPVASQLYRRSLANASRMCASIKS